MDNLVVTRYGLLIVGLSTYPVMCALVKSTAKQELDMGDIKLNYLS